MTTALEHDLTLLDLLNRSPDPFVPTPASLTERLTQLCQEQGIPATPTEVARTVALYQQQQRTDQQLVTLLARLPDASTAQTNAEALLERLQAQCEAQQLTVTPANLQRAVTLFQDQQRPFTLWERPRNDEERRAALDFIRNKKERHDTFSGAILISGLGVCAASLVGALVSMFDMAHNAHLISKMLFMSPLSLVFGVILSLFYNSMFDPQDQTMPFRYWKWFQAHGGYGGKRPLKDMKRLRSMAPDLRRLQTWMEHPEARQALALLSKTAVPITEEDASRLDTMVRLAEAQKAKKTKELETQTWHSQLAALRENAS